MFEVTSHSNDKHSPGVRDLAANSDGEDEPAVAEPVAISDNVDVAPTPIEYSENPVVRTKPNPLKPTAKQIEQHKAAAHVPYSSWCEECVRASGKEDLHKHIEHSEEQLPLFACDYAFLKIRNR